MDTLSRDQQTKLTPLAYKFVRETYIAVREQLELTKE